MHLYLLPLVLVCANAMDRALDHWSTVSRTRRQTRLNCPKGCRTCSDLNGCITCSPRYFIYLKRLDMQQVGSCLSSCPEGYFGVRHGRRGVSICHKCKLHNCDTCFSRNFCMSCTGGFLLHRGTCHEACPRGFSANSRSRECRRTAVPTEEGDCVAGQWSEWGPCLKSRQGCRKRGEKFRTRNVMEILDSKSRTCPVARQTKGCRLGRPRCSASENDKRRSKAMRNRRRDSRRKGKRRRNGRRQSPSTTAAYTSTSTV
uniref:R-spondin-3-like isoform X2 n=1 Tax=Myxine glutinosa TaxID=7769 RepID=UPI00358F16E7